MGVVKVELKKLNRSKVDRDYKTVIQFKSLCIKHKKVSISRIAPASGLLSRQSHFALSIIYLNIIG